MSTKDLNAARARRALNGLGSSLCKICDFAKRRIPKKPIEFAGVVGVFIYAAITFCQWQTLKNSVDTQILISRPVLIQNWTDVIEDGKNTKAWVTFRNFGKSMAVNAIAPGRLYVRDDGAPINSDCSYRCAPTKVWDLETISIAPTTGISDDRPWQQPWSLANGESLDGFNHGRGSKRLYIVGCVYYTDLDRQCHRSDVCLTWQPSNTREPYPLCKEKHRNDID
jgi:hypothetical protein